MIEKLKLHKTLGIDMDGTLVEHPKSHILRDWVRNNWKNHNLYIITFRTGKYLTDVLPELDGYYLPRHAWKGVYGVPPELFTARAMFSQLRRSGRLEGPLEKEEREYNEWKGRMCSNLGATLLIDDRTHDILPGCIKYDIDLLHPDQL